MVFGRSPLCEVSLNDKFLSRRHCRLYRSGEALWVEDLGSHNGTRLNGVELTEPRRIHAGDEIRISSISITLLGPRSTRPESSLRSLDDRTILRSASSMLESHAPTTVSGLQGEAALRRTADRLALLNEIHRTLARPLELGELLEQILDGVFDRLRPEQGAIFLRRDDRLERVAKRTLPGAAEESLLSRHLIDEVIDKRMAALVTDAASDERFAAAESIVGVGIRSLVAAPLLDSEDCLGMVVLASSAAVRSFQEEDLELLVSIASVAALSIRNVALAAEAAERRRLAAELALGRRIQVALLPDHLPEPSGWELAAGNIPSIGVSGDYYVAVERPGGCVLMIADVSGKGVGASLLTASLEALAAVPIADGLPPDAICHRLSGLLFERTPPEKYATSVIAELAAAGDRIRYSNAGHNPPLLVRSDGRVEWLGPTGPPIGLLAGAGYTAAEVAIGPGDLLVLYTDGITGACRADDEEYGPERLARIVARRYTAPLDELMTAIEADLDAFVGDVPFADDRTVVLARREG